MPTLPTKREFVSTVHEWSVTTPCDAKDFWFQTHNIYRQIQDLIGEKKASMDDGFEVSVGDDEIIFRVKVKAKKEKT